LSIQIKVNPARPLEEYTEEQLNEDEKHNYVSDHQNSQTENDDSMKLDENKESEHEDE
jgi:hypothetical protein